jgi:hypothetical protein
VIDLEGRHGDIKDGLRLDILRGKKSGRLRTDDIDLTLEFCARMVGAMLRLTESSNDGDLRAKLTAIDTLVLLGLTLSDAQAVVEQELASLESELANLDQEVLAS